MAEEQSDLQTSADDESHTQKRKQIANRRYLSDSESDIEPLVASPPRRKKQRVYPTTSVANCDALPPLPTTPVFSPLTGQTNGKVQEELHQTPTQTSSLVSPTERKLLFLLESLNAKVDDLTSKVNESTKKVEILLAGGKEDDDDLSDRFNFPLQTTEAVTDLDEQLKSDKTVEKALVRHLSLIGGRTAEDTVRRTMSYCLSNTLAQKYNWIGKGEKAGFAHTELNNTIYRAIQQNRSTRKATKAEVEHTQKAWLRYAKDREDREEMLLIELTSIFNLFIVC